MKKKINYKKYLIALFFVFSFFAGIYFSVNGKIFFTLTTLKDILYKPFLDLSNNNTDIVGKYINMELVEENNKLKDIAGITSTLSGFKNINATIIQRDNTYWLDNVTINRGKSSGIDIGMAVVVSEGLIGKVVGITNDTSVVKLITSSSNNNKISVKLKTSDSYIYRVLEVEGDDLVINGIPNDIENLMNSAVLTSGLSDIYPSGIIIGKVNKIESDKFKTSKKAYIKSNVNFDNLRFVTVLEREA